MVTSIGIDRFGSHLEGAHGDRRRIGIGERDRRALGQGQFGRGLEQDLLDREGRDAPLVEQHRELRHAAKHERHVVRVAAAAGAGDAGIAAIMSTQAAAIQEQRRFSRQNEQEADRIGILNLEQAGYDPRAMPEMTCAATLASSLPTAK